MQIFNILIYHRILKEPDPLTMATTEAQLKQHLAILKQHYHVLPLYEAFHRLQEGSLPPRVVCITFDDGYLDNYEIAYPLLQTYGMKASFFIATGCLQGGILFYDQVVEGIRQYHALYNLDARNFDCSTLDGKRSAIDYTLQKVKKMSLPERDYFLKRFSNNNVTRIMMNATEIQELQAAGMHIGAHTVNHPILTSLSEADAFNEIQTSKNTLENLLQKSIDWFAYPNGKAGDYSLEHINMLKQLGFTGALTTHSGKVGVQTDAYQLPRFTPWRTNSLLFRVQQAKQGVVAHYE